MRYRVKLTKIESSHSVLRTNEVIGFCEDLPKSDSQFYMYGEGLTTGSRHVTTSLVISVEYENPTKSLITFYTLYSKYGLEILQQGLV